jgi:pimeloyl-ACP methyl ester carboxylesterase
MQKLLLLHGALGSAAQFSQLKELLSDTFEIHTLNFSGHGGREVGETITIPGFAEEVIAYLNEKDIATISIFGYSMGGYVGLYLAKHHPDRIEKLFTFGTKLNWTAEGSAKETAMLNPDVVREKVPKYAAILEGLHGKNWEKLMLKTADMMLGLGAAPTLNPDDFLQIDIPVLLGVGDKDVMVSVEETVNVYRFLSNAQLLVLPNTPHPIDRVNQEVLAQLIRNYFL